MSLSHHNNDNNDNQKSNRQQSVDDDNKDVDDCFATPHTLLDPPQSTTTTTATTTSSSTTTTPTATKSSKSIQPCCFYYKFGVCDPPRPPCRFDHVQDDGMTPCCFGATCRMGHAKRVRELVGATYDQRVAYWTQRNKHCDNNANANHHDPKEVMVTTRMPLTPAQRNASLLQSQLEPWSTSVLRERLVTVFGQNRHDWEAAGRAAIMEHLLHCYQQQLGSERRRIDIKSAKVMEVPPSVQQALLGELKQWRAHHTINTRPSIHAESYMILRKDCLSTLATTTTLSRKARQAHKKLHQFASLWHMACHTLAQIVGPHDPAFCRGFSALAVTYNFRGSPHIDKQNTGPFYGLSLGDFGRGGGICVEASYDTVAVCDSHNRFVKVDGRFPHWVDEYINNGNGGSCYYRYSLIYYSTTDQYQPPTVPYYFGHIVDDDNDDDDDKDIDES